MHSTCPKCHAPLGAASLNGLCPRCVALDFLTPTDFDGGETSAHPVGIDSAQDRRVGDYELLEELGRGGMGVVYRARQLSLGREVAVKFLLHGPLAGDAAVARFQAEAEAAASLRHPNIVTTFEIGEDRGRFFHAMELVRGQTLADLTRDGPIGCARAAGYLRHVAAALQYAHERGVLHRDLKPANVLIDQQDEPRVTDFGIAKRLESGAASPATPNLTLTGQVLGTPAYISPEQAAGGTVDARSDVYSLGALLYQLITGRPPFAGESPTHVLRQVAETEPVAPRLLNDAVPRDLETICFKCLEKEPSRRYASAGDLADDLGRLLASEPIRARPISPAERGWRWCKRKPALAASLGGMALLLLGIAVVSSLATRRIAGLRRDALINLYASDMRLAQQAIAESKFGAALELLERHQPRAGDPDLRGFEWRHFRELCRSAETASLERHSHQVQRVAFSPDGRWLATAATDIQVWDFATRRRVLHFPVGDFIWSLAFSPDGRELFAGDGGGSVWRYDVSQTPAPARFPAVNPSSSVLGTLTNLHSRVIAFCWPRDASRVRLVLADGLLTWDGSARQAERVADFHTAFARTQVSPDGRFAAALTGPNKVGAWKLDPPELVAEFVVPVPLRAAAIAPDGSRLAVGGYSGILRTWELHPNGHTNVITAHRGLIEALSFSPDGQRLASAGADQIVRLHDAATGASLGEWRGHRGTIMVLAFSPDGRWLISGDKRGEVKLWDVGVKPGNSAVTAGRDVMLSPDGARLLTRMEDSSFTVQDSVSHEEPVQTWRAPDGWWLLPSAQAVAAIDEEGQLESLQAGGTWQRHSIGGLTALPGGALSPDGRFAALRVKGLAGIVWDLAASREVLRATNDSLWLSPTFSTDSRRLAYGSPSGWVRVWELPSGKTVNAFQAHQNNYAYACDLSPDGRRVATAGFDGVVKLWEVEHGTLLGEYRSPADAYWTVALSPDGRRLAAGTSESSIVLWDVASREEVATFQLGESLRPVEGLLRFAPDGTVLLHANRVLHQWLAPALSKFGG